MMNQNGIASLDKSTHLTIDQLQNQCSAWLSELSSSQNELKFLKELVMTHATSLTDKNVILRFRFLASHINGELREELKTLFARTHQLESMIRYFKEESLQYSDQEIYDDFDRLRRRHQNFRFDFGEARDEIMKILNDADVETDRVIPINRK